MFELKFKRVTLTFDFSFFAVMTLMLLFGDNMYLALGFVTCIWHETGHLLMMLSNNIGVKNICFYGGGIKIIPDKQIDFTQTRTGMAVLLAGSSLNFITAAILWNSECKLLQYLAVINSAIGAFNMLPLQFLDGGKILVRLIRNLCSYQRAILLERFLKWINVILIITVILTFLFIGRGNITLFATLCCLLVSAVLYDNERT